MVNSARGVAELTSVTLSNNMQRIGYQAFSDCEQLSKVAYVGEMKTADCMVEIGAFQNCTSLTSFAFPQCLSEVQGWTFVGCRKLKEIILPKSVKKVGDQALRTNSTVETITFEGEEAPELTGNPFPFKENILKIMVPSGKSEAYKAKWGSYEGYHFKIEEKS
nr:leucine-rich repeat domain-containing protein [Phocaeicola plebeius]